MGEVTGAKKVNVRAKVAAELQLTAYQPISLVTKETLQPCSFERRGSQSCLENNTWVPVLFLSPLFLCWNFHTR